MVEEEKRVYSLFCFLKKKAILLLKEGKSLAETEERLFDYLIEFGLVERREHAITVEEIKKEKNGDVKTTPLSLVCFTTPLRADSS